MTDELRRRAQVRAIAFFDRGRHEREDRVGDLTRLLVEFVHEMLVGDIGDGPFIHWLERVPPMNQRRFAVVKCGRTFNLHRKAGRLQACEDIRFVTCPKCRSGAALDGVKAIRSVFDGVNPS